ncbi:hypothetical protein [Pseudophaeobacter sp.]|uniref:hypothetical protein n=1 Tax=Pseudophaeobacter sp. TaxID=1971739 RepID=UPI003A970A6C
MLQFLTELFKPKPAPTPPITAETSMNFEARDIGPFLARLAGSPRFELPRDFAATITDALPDLDLGQTRRWRIDGDFDQRAAVLEIQVFMDDFDAPDLSFFSSAPVIAAINAELDLFDDTAERPGT